MGLIQRKKFLRGCGSALAEPLEARWLLSHSLPTPDADDIAIRDPDAISLTVLANAQSNALSDLTVPQLSSNPGAPVTIYLDFSGAPAMTWGTYSVPTTPAYDQDGDASTFSNSELTSINQIWQIVAESYSQFNINVTTIAPASLIHGQNLEVIIGGDSTWYTASAGGVSYIGAFANSSSPNISFVFPDSLADGAPKYVGEAAAHEAGHQFGLYHQAVWSGTTLLEDYNPGTTDKGPIMGNPYADTRALWYDGVNDRSSTTYQDDMATIASLNNGVTYRDDEVSHTLGAPTTLSATASGILATTSQVDYYDFTTVAGTISINASQFSIPGVYDGMLQLKFSLYNSSDQLIESSSAGLTETMQTAVPAGSYIIAISSDGLYGDVGQYTLSEAPVTAPPTIPTNPDAVESGSSSIHVSWSDPIGDQTGFYVERSANNFSYTQVDATGLTSFDDTNLPADTTYYYRIRAYNSNGDSDYTSIVSATTLNTPPAAPSNLIATAINASEISLSWQDDSNNEAGFYIERSQDGSDWTQIYTTAANATGYTDSGLNPVTNYYYRVQAFNNGGDSDYSDVDETMTLAPPPAVPTGLQAVAPSPAEIDLTWQDGALAASYSVEESMDDNSWSIAGTSQTFSFQSLQLNAGTNYYYRVAAHNSGGDSDYSAAVEAKTLSTAMDAASQLVVTEQPSGVTAGVDLGAFTVAVEDASGDVVSNDVSSVMVGMRSGPAGAVMQGTETAGVNGGVAVFSDLNFTQAGNYSLMFSDGTLGSVVSGNFVVAAGAASQMVLGSAIPNVIAGATLPAITVEVEDQYGNRVSGSASIGLDSSLGGLTWNATAVNGVATFSGISLDTAGEYLFSATEGSLPAEPSNSFDVSPAAAAKLVFGSQPASGVAGAGQPTIRVEVEDQYGNLAADDSTVSLAALGQNFQATAVDGVATFSGVAITGAGTFSVAATDGGLTGAESNQITISPAAPAYLAIAQQPVAATAGAGLSPIVVEVLDQYGNLTPSANSSVSLALSNGPGAASLGAISAAISNGEATFANIIFTVAGAYTLVAMDGNLTSADTTTINVKPAAATKMMFAAQPTNSIAGVTMSPVMVELFDAYGNVATDDGSRVTLQPSSGAAAVTAAVQNGLANFSDLSFTQARSYTLTASDGSLPTISSSNFTVSPGAAAAVSVLAPTGVDTSGQALALIIVQVKDPFGNIVNEAPVTGSIASGPMMGNLTGTLTATTGANGNANFSDLLLDRAGVYTLTFASGGVSGTSDPLTIEYGSPSLVFASEPGDITAGGKLAALTIDTDDVYGNLIALSPKGKVSLSISSGGKIIGMTSAAIKAGVATFNKLSIRTAGTYTLTATASGLGAAYSDSFTVSAGAIAKMSFLKQPANSLVGTAFEVVVDGADRYGNAISGVGVTLGLAGRASGAMTALNEQMENGIADFEQVGVDQTGVYALIAQGGGVKISSKKFAVK